MRWSALVASLSLFVGIGGSVGAQPSASDTPIPALSYPSPNAPGWWVNAEYLLWWTKNQPLPVPVLSTNSLDAPGVEVLLGGGAPFHSQPHHGARFTVGAFLDSDGRLSVEGSYFFLGQRNDYRQVNSSGAPDSIRMGYPFASIGPTDETTEALVTLAIPGAISNSTTLTMSTRMQGFEANGLYNLIRTGNARFDFLAGGRYINLKEDLTLTTLSPIIPPAPPNDYTIIDQFGTRNQFYGGQLGARLEVNAGRFFVAGTAKVAIGCINQDVNVSGFFRRVEATRTLESASGFYTQPSNIGEHSRDRFGFVPEVNLNVGFHVTERLRVFGGYNFLYMSNVLRPGDQIDRVINSSQLTVFGGTGDLIGPARPVVPFNDSSFWAQGINFGIEFRY